MVQVLDLLNTIVAQVQLLKIDQGGESLDFEDSVTLGEGETSGNKQAAVRS